MKDSRKSVLELLAWEGSMERGEVKLNVSYVAEVGGFKDIQ